MVDRMRTGAGKAIQQTPLNEPKHPRIRGYFGVLRGRGDWIRASDLLNPMQARDQRKSCAG